MRTEGLDGRDSAGFPPLPLTSLHLLYGFAVQREVEAFAFHRIGHPQTNHRVDVKAPVLQDRGLSLLGPTVVFPEPGMPEIRWLIGS